MAKYDITTHQLAFGSLCKTLTVIPVTAAGDPFSLIEEGKAIRLEIVDGEYEITEVPIPENPKIAIEHAENDKLTFDRAILGGTVVIDLRDMGRYGNPSTLPNGRYETSFNLEGTPHIFWNTREGKGLKIYFEDEYCHELVP